ncbi:hypothetical protein ACJX0J_004919 [Zea mays]
MLSIACVDQFLVAFSLVDSYFIVWRNNFFYYNIILNQTDMYISKRFSSEVKSTKVTQKMDKIVSVTNKNIYRESLLTSSKLENFIKIKYFVFLFNEYQADGLNYTRNPGFKEKRYGLDCIEPWIGAETQWKLMKLGMIMKKKIHNFFLELFNQILQFIWINRTRIKERCDKNSMNLMLFIK